MWNKTFVLCRPVVMQVITDVSAERFASILSSSGMVVTTYITVIQKIYPATRHAGGKGERICSSYSFLKSAPGGVSGQLHSPAAI
jgi:hypothetical protein